MAWIDTKVVHRTDWAEGLMTLRLDTSLEFTPGQFVNLGFDVSGQRERRSYSIASASGAPLELFITIVEGGMMTPHLKQLAPGDPIPIEDRALGFLTLDDVPEFARDLWLLSTGTGLAPFISMLRSGVLLPRFDNVVVVNAARSNDHLAYQDELRRSERESSGRLQYFGMVTREEPVAGNVQGRITSGIESRSLERLSGVPLDPERVHVMLCGNPEMIQEAMELLKGRGLKRNRRRDPGHLTIEKYW